MSELFKPKSKEEFFEEVDKSLQQAKDGKRLDAFEAIDTLSKELEAGYNAIKEMHESQTDKKAV